MIVKEILKNSYQLDTMDVQLLLMHVLSCSRVYLISHADIFVTSDQYKRFLELIDRRQQGEPIAYILGRKSFWNLELNITPAVLIPRPETELIVEWVLNRKEDFLSIADLGTGSGAIALSIAQEKPNWQVIATDASENALQIAKTNAEKYALKNVEFYLGDWCYALPEKKFDIIVSNPPYIAQHDPHLKQGDVRFEPKTALIADEEGLAEVKKITEQARNYLKDEAYLIIEHGYDQGEQVRQIFKANNYQAIQTINDYAGHARLTLGQLIV